MRPRSLFAMCAAPLLASCVFLLDYDKLQAGDPTPDAGGAPNDGTAGQGNEGGSEASCGNCNDRDPCTIDTCDATGAQPACRHQTTEGLKPDGFETTLTAPQYARVSMVGSGQLFYLAAFETSPAKISLFKLANDGSALEPMGADLKLDGAPVSNAGLAVEELALGDVALHGFVAAKTKLGDARVFHVVSHDDKSVVTLAGLSYKADNPTLFPQALTIGGKAFGAWIQADGAIAVHNPGMAKTDTVGNGQAATTLSLLATTDEQPATLFTTANGAFVAAPGQDPAPVPECETRAGSYLSSSVINTQVPGVWLANITRAGDDYLTTGGATLSCAKNVCAASGEDCKKNPSPNALREVTGATVHFDEDEAGIIYSVLALPQIALKAEDSVKAEGRLSLILARVDLRNGLKPVTTTIGGDPVTGLMEIAHNDVSDANAFAGPDWPVVAILPSQHVAVAWLQPSQTAPEIELRVQRYKMCLPKP